MPKGVHNGPRGGDFGGGRPRTNADLPPEKRRRQQGIYCSDEERARLKAVLKEWRKAETANTEDRDA